MYKNLSPAALGVSGRQSELIELSLTYGFRGFDMDIDRFVKQAQRGSLERARRFIDSAKKFSSGCAIGGWRVSARWSADEPTFQQDLSYLKESAEVAGQIGSGLCYTTIEPAHDALPYHENFERHRTRIAQAADVLGEKGIKLALDFRPAPEFRKDKAHEFIHDFEGLVTLCGTVGAENVGIVLDTWNWMVGGGGKDQLRELKPGQVVMVRLANVPSTADLAEIAAKQRLLPTSEGLVDCPDILKILVEKNFEGPVSVFPHPSLFTGRTREAIVQAAADSLEKLWQAAGLSKVKPEPVLVKASVNGDGGGDDDDSGSDSDDESDSDES